MTAAPVDIERAAAEPPAARGTRASALLVMGAVLIGVALVSVFVGSGDIPVGQA